VTRKPLLKPLQVNANPYRHIRRVFGYARPVDWLLGAAITVMPPAGILLLERIAPTGINKSGMAKMLRLNWAVGLGGGFLAIAQQSSCK
jgi:hypothetical protein